MPEPILRVEKVTKRFSGLVAVSNVSIDVDEGSVTGIVGPNGAGKSTLLGGIAGFSPFNSGRVMFGKRDVTKLPAHRICALGITRTFQHAQSFETLSVADTLTVAALLRRSPSAARQRALEIAEYLHVDPKGSPDTLTPRDRSVLEVGKGMATEATVLLVDEVMAGLSETEQQELLELLDEIRSAGVTMIFVEHNIPIVRQWAEKVYVMDHGEVIAVGPPDSVFQNELVIQSYLGD